MKVIHVVWGLGLGGIETMLVNIANNQARLGHKIYIIAINNIVEESLVKALDDSIEFVCLKRGVGSKNPYPFIRLNYLLKRLAPDIIHIHRPPLIKYIFLPSLRRRTCTTMHDVCNESIIKGLKECRRIFAISKYVKEDIYNQLGLNAVLVNNGIQPEKINHDAFNNSRFVVVQISRLDHTKKGQHILLKAISILRKRGLDVYADMIGDGPSKDYLLQLRDELGLGDCVRFLGEKNQQFIYEHLHEYSLLVQPSVFEGFGLTVTEAMAAKIPVLVSQNQGPLEIIDNGTYGYFFNNGDEQDCAKKIELFYRGQDEKNKIESAFLRVYECYNVINTAKSYLGEYKKIIEEVG